VNRGILYLTFAMLLCAMPAAGQDEERIQKLFDDAVTALGGQTYMEVKDIVSEGHLFYFNRQGDSSGLIRYYDWTKLPDKSRNEVGNKKKLRDVVVFNLQKNEGWILEGQKNTRDANPENMDGFKAAVKHSLENIFRLRWKDPANRLFYLGPGVGADVRYEMVRLLDPENDEVTVFFDRASRLPAKIEYRNVDKQGVQLRHVEEYSQWHVIQGVNTALRTDSFINGRKAAQQFVVKISYNNNLPDEFFVKPVPPK